MPTTPVPYVNPTAVTFYLDECPKQSFGIFNPFPQDILFKVDNAHPEKYKISPMQGVVSSKHKFYIDLECMTKNVISTSEVLVKFFKWSRPRHGQKSRAQQYLGYRTVRVNVYQTRTEEERAPSEIGSVTFSDMSEAQLKQEQLGSIYSSYSSVDSSAGALEADRSGAVITNVILSVFLLVFGFILSNTSEDWFSANLFESIKPQTLAIVFYTLAGVLVIKLLTFR
ncbi:uncharacterized protein LOC131953523 [Physella acuta]|uniref:uncharacterized protein LOC131953523 n=1 Tax=Physella acuta TaxID=109671 RepID=UPI0027DD5909|nr:uncharacterized protein LOC131953523 [Physella acuta]